jgi:hypothetical protein
MLNTEYICIELKQADRQGYWGYMIRHIATQGDMNLFLSHIPTVYLVKMPFKFNGEFFSYFNTSPYK